MNQEKLTFIRQNAPCYIYDRQRIIENCLELKRAIPEAVFLYSLKTNPFPPVAETISKQGFGADAASAQEVLLAHSLGIPRELIYYSAPGKTEQDIEKTWDKCTIIADSLHELQLLEKFAVIQYPVAQHAAARAVQASPPAQYPTAHSAQSIQSTQHTTVQSAATQPIRVGLRINPAFSMDGAEVSPSKFGIDEELLTAAALDFPHLQICGIHVHLRSQILDADTLCAYYRNCCALAERLDKLPSCDISFINFGSGIGTVYDESCEKPLDLKKISRTLQELRQRNPRPKFILETGRFLTCCAGKYYTRVADIKESRGKTYVVVQNALNGFLRPAIAELLRQNLGEFPASGREPLYTSAHQCSFRVIRADGDCGNCADCGNGEGSPASRKACERVDLVGNLCTPLDVLARDIDLPHIEIGDIVEVSNAGSYGHTLTPQLFSSQEPAKEFLL